INVRQITNCKNQSKKKICINGGNSRITQQSKNTDDKKTYCILQRIDNNQPDFWVRQGYVTLQTFDDRLATPLLPN
ncbi:hypothetical protein, partial [Cedecea sp. P7760]|uniref:hypothetical protein n=1 Tax=Cedecea sp. P7760 TaxID=2726983 RepID=UPI001C43588F